MCGLYRAGRHSPADTVKESLVPCEAVVHEHPAVIMYSVVVQAIVRLLVSRKEAADVVAGGTEGLASLLTYYNIHIQ